MGRLSRAEQQEVTRQRVLDAAKYEFTERGFRRATVDGIADRADLTRGAVYSNFPSKRALYFSVLAREAEHAPLPAPKTASPAHTAMGKFASTWAEVLPTTQHSDHLPPEKLTSPALSIDLIPEIQSEKRMSVPFAQLIKLDAIILGLALEAESPTKAPTEQFIDMANSALTILYGATQLAFAAPGFVDPQHIISLCEQLTPYQYRDAVAETPSQSPPPQRVSEIWTPPTCIDSVHHRAVRPSGTRVIAVLGMHKIDAIRDAVVAASGPHRLSVALVTDDQTGELAPLAKLALADLSRGLRYAFPAPTIPDVQVIVDQDSQLAHACGLDALSNNTEAAIAVTDNQIQFRALGTGACHSTLSAAARSDT
ncbi:TetR/AcrR family transcriptional regulator [Nocardia africana]|uniref:TetR/AcrR family transcriptional regulator n=1 Tax=Nocardia africana TaxID=134964 RepID=A0ABW6NU63_9NOCA